MSIKSRQIQSDAVTARNMVTTPTSIDLLLPALAVPVPTREMTALPPCLSALHAKDRTRSLRLLVQSGSKKKKLLFDTIKNITLKIKPT